MSSAAGAVSCAPDVAVLSDSQGHRLARINVEVADDDSERETGLMNRPHMPASSGMLFVYPTPRQVAFWMRNTLIPLDIIFFDQKGRFVSVQAQARPLDETPLPSAGPAQFVLEINGGLAAKLGIGQGTVLSHPAIPASTADQPCLP